MKKLILSALIIISGFACFAMPLQAFAAIAFDNAASPAGVGTGTGSQTTSFTVGAGSNEILYACAWVNSTTKTFSSITYNGSAMTLLSHDTISGNGGNYVALYYMLGPPSGAHNIVATVSATGNQWGISAASYSGVLQTGFPDALVEAGNNSGGTITSVLANSWITNCVAGVPNGYTTTYPGSKRASVSDIFAEEVGFFADTNAAQSTGSHTLNYTSPGNNISIAVSMAPVPDPVTSIESDITFFGF